MTCSNRDFKGYVANLLASEQNQVRLPEGASLSVALVYPNTYTVGLANLGFQTIYRLLNELPDVRCERAFFYSPPFQAVARTLESNRPLREFDIIAFSLSFELDNPNVVEILLNAGISPLAVDRNSVDPVIICGGVVTFFNPTPIAPFMDLILIGEGEELIKEFIQGFQLCRDKRLNKKQLCDELSRIEGVYSPQSFLAKNKIRKRYVKRADFRPSYSCIVTPNSHFQQMFLVEVGRGCSRGCRFCVAGHVYRPFRLSSVPDIVATIKEKIFATNKIGLVGAALSDFKDLEGLCESLVNDGYQLGISSLRLDALSPRFIACLQKAGVKTLTLAPEAGSEKLRKIIKKHLSDEQILAAVELLTQSDIGNLKLYFMIGLPLEEEDDVENLVHLVEKIRRIYLSAPGRRQITVSINTFIPKPFTPFQWCPMADEKSIKKKRSFLTGRLQKLKGVSVSPKSIRSEVLQGIFSLGGPEVVPAIIYHTQEKMPWKKAFQKAGVDYRQIIHREKSLKEDLPWDFIDGDLDKEWLWTEWQKATDY